MITRDQLRELENKLIIENRSSNYLNACMSRDGKSKVDIFSIQSIIESKSLYFDKELLLQDGNLSFEPDNSSIENTVAYYKLLENLNGIIQKQTQIARNKGIDSLKIGYPLISYQTKTSQADCFLAPIFLIDIKVNANTRLIEISNVNAITINPNLITAVKSNNLPVSFENSLNGIKENLAIPEIISKFIEENSDFLENKFSEQIQKIPFQSKPELFSNAEALPKLKIHNSGTISNFIGSNIGIINDLKSYTSGIEDVAPFSFKIRQYPKQNLDPSQLHAIESFNKNKHLIIHGPPGTGKSQTITGIITSALAEKKTVLVVCEKRAALDVILSNLAKEDLDTHVRTITNIDTDQNRIIREIRELGENIRLRNSGGKLDQNLLNQQELILTTRAQELVKSKMALSWDIIPKNKWKDLVGRSINSEDCSHINVPENKIKSWIQNIDSTIIECEKAVKLSPQITNHQYLKELINFDINSNDIISNLKTIKILLEKSEDLLQKQIEGERNLTLHLQSELSELTRKVTQQKNDLIYCQQKVDTIIKFYNDFFLGKVNLKSIRTQNIQTSINTLETLEVELTNAASWAFELTPEFFTSKKINFFKYITEKQYRINRSKLKKINTLILENTGENIIATISQLIFRVQELRSLLQEIQTKCGNNFEAYSLQENKSIFQTEITISRINLLLNNSDPISIESINNTIKNDSIRKIENIKNEIESNINQITNNQTLTNRSREFFLTNREEFKNEIVRLLNATSEIINYAEYRSIVSEVFGNADLHPKIHSLRLFYNKLSQLMLKEFHLANNSLTTNKEDLINYISDQTTNAQNNSKILAKKNLHDRFKEGMSNAANFSTIFALRGRNKKSLREICNGHPEVFINCCPVLLTTPDVVSTLFSGKSNIYDLIIFDEASQIEIHNSIGAFQKGKAKIVAGDQHQMPPSSYFLKRGNTENFEQDEVYNEINEQEQQAFLDVESLLDFCISNQTAEFESKYLDFHYRSEHPALIRFSNEAIYKRLVIKPTSDIDYKPFEFVYQANGIWENGENFNEATSVIEIINGINITQEKIPLVIVGTLNINQANLISKLITSKRIADTKFEEKFTQLESKGFAIVNLEHLQGDECDIMILSTGYGPNREGSFRSQFIFKGTNGYRLLNVAITRARYKNILVTSIPKAIYRDYLPFLSNDEINPKTRGLFYAYINYVEAFASNNIDTVESICENIRKYFLASNNPIIEDDGDFESPFEEEVYNVLLTRFESSEITLQENHGKSGFRIDMVIRPKQCPFLKIAIECDGATYHSGWSNQILDSHRQSLLEKANYKFVRIWSTDWWQNSDGAQMKLFSKINELLDNYLQHESVSISWLNDIITTPESSEEVQNKFLDEIIYLEDNNEDDSDVITQNRVITKKIGRSCSVRLAVNGNHEKFFSISDYNQNSSSTMNADAPLAKLLFDKKEGDMITFNNFEYQVLEII